MIINLRRESLKSRHSVSDSQLSIKLKQINAFIINLSLQEGSKLVL